MHPFALLLPALALVLGQVSGTEQAVGEPAGGQETAEPRPEAAPAPEPRPPAGDTAAEAGAARPGSRQPGTAESRRKPVEPERTQVARAALTFLDALIARDAGQLTAACSERFSFDGDLRSGKEEIRRSWRALLADRDTAQQAKLLDLELLPAADAVSRLGPPPPRVAPLVRGTWVAIANVSRRPLVLFLAREGARWAVIGME